MELHIKQMVLKKDPIKGYSLAIVSIVRNFAVFIKYLRLIYTLIMTFLTAFLSIYCITHNTPNPALKPLQSLAKHPEIDQCY